MRPSDKVLRIKWKLVNLAYRLVGKKRGTVLERLVTFKSPASRLAGRYR